MSKEFRVYNPTTKRTAGFATLPAARAYLQTLGNNGAYIYRSATNARVPRGSDAEIIADLKQATPSQQQQARADNPTLYDATLARNALIRFPSVERTAQTPEDAAEEALAQMRVRLGQAYACECYANHMPNGTLAEQEARSAERELADAYGASAANKLARAYYIMGKVLPIEWARK